MNAGREGATRRDAGGRRPRRQWPLRLVGSLFGVGAGVVGLLSLLGAGDLPDFERERATGFGIAALVVGAVALLGSLGVRDAHALWYCSPRRCPSGQRMTPAQALEAGKIAVAGDPFATVLGRRGRGISVDPSMPSIRSQSALLSLRSTPG